MTNRMPVLFLAHGNPMNALADNAWTRAWKSIGERLEKRPAAVLAISAHWYIPGVAVTSSPHPRTIHDFGGFPKTLFEMQYPAPGSAQLVERVAALLAGTQVSNDETWGLDHGTWSVLCHVFPEADVPVVQLSIDETKPPQWHYDLARRLAPLRDEGVLIVGSGNIVHNLEAAAWGDGRSKAHDWAERFDALAAEFIERGQHQPLIDYEALGGDALLSIPTPEHYLPLLYALAARQAGDALTFPTSGIDLGSISMRSIAIG
jgi:4,5-DOPA dioxygenase extradiol